MKFARLVICALILFLAPSYALAQGPTGLCVWLINQTTGALSCQNVGQSSSSSVAYNPLPVGGVANAAAPTFPEGRLGYLSFDLSGNLRTSASFSPSSSVAITDGIGTDATGTFTNATQTTSISAGTIDGYGTVTVSINGTYGTASAVFEQSDDGGVTYYAANCGQSGSLVLETGYTSLTNTSRMWRCAVQGADTFRLRSTAVASGTVNALLSISAMPNPNGAVVGSVVTDAAGNGRGANVSAANELQVGSGTLATAANQTSPLAPVAPATATATKSQLIGCQATSAAINPTTGQQAAIDCDLNNNVLVSSGGAPNLTTAQVTVTTSNTAVVAARALRRSVTITNITGTQQVYCSGTTATTGNGQLIPAVVGATWNVSTTAAINCIAVSSSQTVSTSETF